MIAGGEIQLGPNRRWIAEKRVERGSHVAHERQVARKLAIIGCVMTATIRVMVRPTVQRDQVVPRCPLIVGRL